MSLDRFITEPCTVTNPGAETISDEGTPSRAPGTQVDALMKRRLAKPSERTVEEISEAEWVLWLLPTTLEIGPRSAVTDETGLVMNVTGPVERPRHPVSGEAIYVKVHARSGGPDA